MKHNILFLAADPTNVSRLRLGEESREIQEKLQLAKLRDHFDLYQRFSIRPSDFSQALLDTNPFIVHFSGHGLKGGAICIEDKNGKMHPIQPNALSNLFEQFSDNVKCVILNSCYSKTQASAISQHVDYVIGMNKAIGDKAAIAFSAGFYQALGAGRTIEESYKLGCVQILMENIPENLTPVLISKSKQSEPSSQPLPERNNRNDIVRIALWGPRASGKTTFISMLYRACMKEDNKWAVKPYDSLSTDFILGRIKELSQGMFPASTPPQEMPQTYNFEFALRESKSKQRFVVEFTDIPGEEYLTSSLHSPVWEFLSTCDGIICLLDPSQASQHIDAAFRLLQGLFIKLREEKPAQTQLPHHIAFCFSKIDMDEFYKYLETPLKLVEMLEGKIGINMKRLLDAYFLPAKVNFFCVSSIGVDNNQQSLLKNKATILFNEINPINVLQPVEWLLDTLTYLEDESGTTPR